MRSFTITTKYCRSSLNVYTAGSHLWWSTRRWWGSSDFPLGNSDLKAGFAWNFLLRSWKSWVPITTESTNSHTDHKPVISTYPKTKQWPWYLQLILISPVSQWNGCGVNINQWMIRFHAIWKLQKEHKIQIFKKQLYLCLYSVINTVHFFK